MYHFRILKKAFLIVAHLVKEFPAFFFFFSVEPSSSIHYESLPADLIPSLRIQSAFPHPILKISFNSIVPSTPLFHISSVPLEFVSKIFISHLSRACYMTCQFLLVLLFQSRQYRCLYCCI
jgi:hypothetical protein